MKEFKEFIDKVDIHSLTKPQIEEIFEKYRYLNVIQMVLIKIIINKSKIGYKELLKLTGIDSYLPEAGKYLGTFVNKILNLINLNDFFHGRPLSSIVVVNKGKNFPSDSFFEFAEKIKLFDRNYETEKEFYEECLERLYGFWC